VAEAAGRWLLFDFEERFDAWVALEQPSPELRVLVLDWILTRQQDPYRGVRREPGFDNLWFGAVPRSSRGTGRAVTCSYWVYEADHTVRCDSFASLSPPF